MRRSAFAVLLMLIGLLTSACTTTVHRNVWFDDDGQVVRKHPPPGSELPEARADSYDSIDYGVHVSRTEGNGLFVNLFDHPQFVATEPLDLDLRVRIEGEPGAWVTGPLLTRRFKPINVDEGTTGVVTFHVSDWTGEEPEKSTFARPSTVPEGPVVTADVYVEFYLVGREYVTGHDWYYIYEFRYRLVSDHPDWQAYGSELEFAARNGMKTIFPLYVKEEAD